MIDVLEKILKYRKERNWTEYELAKRSDLPQSTISSWYRKNMQPSLTSLDKIADAFGLTLAQMLSEEYNIIASDEEKKLLHEWSRLEPEQKRHLLDFLRSL
jgi:transcriptional regulator with XRE-family HTH domain